PEAICGTEQTLPRLTPSSSLESSLSRRCFDLVQAILPIFSILSARAKDCSAPHTFLRRNPTVKSIWLGSLAILFGAGLSSTPAAPLDLPTVPGAADHGFNSVPAFGGAPLII